MFFWGLVIGLKSFVMVMLLWMMIDNVYFKVILGLVELKLNKKMEDVVVLGNKGVRKSVLEGVVFEISDLEVWFVVLKKR